MKRNSTTWANLGQDVSACKSMEQVLRESGLDYTVEKRPVYTADQQGRPQAIPNRFVTCRTDGSRVYDVVSDRFGVIQNRDAFSFVQYMNDDLVYEKAGETSGGTVYVIGRLPECNILGDVFQPHVIFRNGFNGQVQITAAITPLRVVCQNQFAFAFKNASNRVSIRHAANADAKLEEAKELLKMSADYMTELNNLAEHFAGIKLSPGSLPKVLDRLFPIPDNSSDLSDLTIGRISLAKERFIEAYNADDNSNFRGSAWGLVNAYTDYVTHKPQLSGKKETRAENKFITTTFKVSMNPVLRAVEDTLC